MRSFNRRKFLTNATAASAVMTLGGTAPAFLRQAAKSTNADGKGNDGRILVVVEMAGGNDGLNTVVPFRDAAYRDARPELAISASDVLNIHDDLGFHPSMRGFADLLEDGHLAIVQGVGYPNPNRSHFESMDIWHTCQRKTDNRGDGWLGRYLEAVHDATVTDPPGVHLGDDKQPFALMSRDVRVPSIRSLDEFRLNGTRSKAFKAAVKDLASARRETGNDLLSFVQSSTSSAISASERIESVGMKAKMGGSFPDNQLAKKLQTVSNLIQSGLQTPIYYVQIGGFDTHAQQANVHESLLEAVSDSVKAFIDSLNKQGDGDRVMCLCFSEFGRRVKENASEGTDHGTAGPMFLAGKHVKAGLIGKHPSLSDLQDGDLKHHTDFRQVYASVLQHWLKCEPSDILKGKFRPVDVVKVTA